MSEQQSTPETAPEPSGYNFLDDPIFDSWDHDYDEPDVYFTVIVKVEDDPTADSEDTYEGIPDGYGYLEPLLTEPDFVRVEFITGLIHTTIIKME